MSSFQLKQSNVALKVSKRCPPVTHRVAINSHFATMAGFVQRFPPLMASTGTEWRQMVSYPQIPGGTCTESRRLDPRRWRRLRRGSCRTRPSPPGRGGLGSRASTRRWSQGGCPRRRRARSTAGLHSRRCLSRSEPPSVLWDSCS